MSACVMYSDVSRQCSGWCMPGVGNATVSITPSCRALVQPSYKRQERACEWLLVELF